MNNTVVAASKWICHDAAGILMVSNINRRLAYTRPPPRERKAAKDRVTLMPMRGNEAAGRLHQALRIIGGELDPARKSCRQRFRPNFPDAPVSRIARHLRPARPGA